MMGVANIEVIWLRKKISRSSRTSSREISLYRSSAISAGIKPFVRSAVTSKPSTRWSLPSTCLTSNNSSFRMANGIPSVPAYPRFRWMRRVSSFAPAAAPTASAEAECRIHRRAICWMNCHPAAELRANYFQTTAEILHGCMKRSNNVKRLTLSLLLAVAFLSLHSATGIAVQTSQVLPNTDPIQGPIVSSPVIPGLSPAVRDLLPAKAETGLGGPINSRQNPLRFEPDQGKRGTWNRINVPHDPLSGVGANPGATPAPTFTFEGTGNPAGCGGCSPPDTSGDVG